LDGGEVVEGVETIGAAAKFSGGLRAAKHEKAKDCGLVASEVEDGANAVLVLGDAGVADRGHEGEIFKRVKGLPNLFFGEIEDRIATRALVTGVEQGIKAKGVVFGRGDLFFDKGAEDAELDRV
jgi:hypothetical protein